MINLRHHFDTINTNMRSLTSLATKKQISQRLQLKKIKVNKQINGVGKSSMNANYSTNIQIKSKYSEYTANLYCNILPNIVGQQPSCPINTNLFVIPKNITLADPTYYQPQNIDLLISATLFFELLCVGQIKLGHELPIYKKNVFGWISFLVI